MCDNVLRESSTRYENINKIIDEGFPHDRILINGSSTGGAMTAASVVTETAVVVAAAAARGPPETTIGWGHP